MVLQSRRWKGGRGIKGACSPAPSTTITPNPSHGSHSVDTSQPLSAGGRDYDISPVPPITIVDQVEQVLRAAGVKSVERRSVVICRETGSRGA